MDHKQAIQIITRMLENRSLSEEEREALNTALGVLGWTSLASARIKRLKDKRDQRKART